MEPTLHPKEDSDNNSLGESVRLALLKSVQLSAKPTRIHESLEQEKLENAKHNRNLRKTISYWILGLTVFETLFVCFLICSQAWEFGGFSLDWEIISPTIVAIFSKIAFLQNRIIQDLFPGRTPPKITDSRQES